MGPAADNDVYVVSDLHLGAGWLEDKQRYSRLETFFYDDEFQRFVSAIRRDQAARGRTATLVLNGDVFDFLSVVRVPGTHDLTHAGIRLDPSERRFGLADTDEKAIWKLDQILTGHPQFVLALAQLLADGHWLVVVRGNHDGELFFESVQRRLLDALARIAEEARLVPRGEALLDRVLFHQWFYYQPGRFYIEHGNQYDRTNAFRFVLNPALPAEVAADRGAALDYPIGSLFVRYLYNSMKLLDPYSTHFVTLGQYVRLAYHYNFMDLFRTILLRTPFLWRALRNARVFDGVGVDDVRRVNEQRLDALAEETALGPQTIRELESMMVRPAGTTKQRLVWEFMKPTARRVGSLLAITALTLVTWSLVFGAIHGTPWLASGVFGKATLLAVLGVITVVGIFLGFSYVNRALNRLPDPAEEAIRDRAERIAALLGVPNVTMGHTHGADYRRMLGGRSTFVNTGTWIPYHGPWDAAAPRSRQFTFAMIRGDTMHLKRWEDDRNEWVLVPLLEEYRPSTFERLLGENEGEAPKEPRS